MRHVNARNSIILFIILISAWLVFLALPSFHVFSSKAVPVIIADNVDLRLQNITYTKTRAGEPLWTLVAESAEHSEDGVTLIDNVQMVFFDQEKGDMHLSADHGKLGSGEREVSVNSNVRVINSSGQTLQTDFLEYKETGNILQTDKDVQISTEDYIVTGRGMLIDIVQRSVVLLHDVKAQFGDMGNHDTSISQ